MRAFVETSFEKNKLCARSVCRHARPPDDKEQVTAHTSACFRSRIIGCRRHPGTSSHPIPFSIYLDLSNSQMSSLSSLSTSTC